YRNLVSIRSLSDLLNPQNLRTPERRRPPMNRTHTRTARWLVFPAVAILLIGMGYPLLWQLVTSTQEFGLAQQFGQPAEFVGFANYVQLATDPGLWGVVIRSLVFCIATAVITLVIGMLIALLMGAVSKGPRLVLQIAMLLAWAM